MCSAPARSPSSSPARIADGSRGAEEIRRRGGLVIVQDPQTAESSVMPAATLETVPDAIVRRAEDIGNLLADLPRNHPTP